MDQILNLLVTVHYTKSGRPANIQGGLGLSSIIQTVTVGAGITPAHAVQLADSTAGGDFHPAPKIGMDFLELQVVHLGRIAGEVSDHGVGVSQVEHLKDRVVGGLVLALDDGVLDA